MCWNNVRRIELNVGNPLVSSERHSKGLNNFQLWMLRFGQRYNALYAEIPFPAK